MTDTTKGLSDGNRGYNISNTVDTIAIGDEGINTHSVSTQNASQVTSDTPHNDTWEEDGNPIEIDPSKVHASDDVHERTDSSSKPNQSIGAQVGEDVLHNNLQSNMETCSKGACQYLSV